MFSPDYFEDAGHTEEEDEPSVDVYSEESDYEIEDEYVRWYGSFEPSNTRFTAPEPTLYVVGEVARGLAEKLARAGGVAAPVCRVSVEEYREHWALEFGPLNHFPAYVLVTQRGVHVLDEGNMGFRTFKIRRILQGRPQV